MEKPEQLSITRRTLTQTAAIAMLGVSVPGCATQNLLLAAEAFGLHAAVSAYQGATTLECSAQNDNVSIKILTDKNDIEYTLEHIIAGNMQQMKNDAFAKELF